jgi:hypothetical protein
MSTRRSKERAVSMCPPGGGGDKDFQVPFDLRNSFLRGGLYVCVNLLPGMFSLLSLLYAIYQDQTLSLRYSL